MFCRMTRMSILLMSSNSRFLCSNLSKIVESRDNSEVNKKILIFISQIFSKFQKTVVNIETIRTQDVINYRSSFKNKNDQNEEDKILKLIQNHDQVKKSFNYISNNLYCFNSKEIAFISKVYNTVSLNSDQNDTLRLQIKEYCLENIQNFDLYDIENITFNYRINKEFMMKSLNVVEKKIKDSKFVSKKLDIEKNNENFENKMCEIDSKQKSQLWLRLNILLNYKKYLEYENQKS